MNDAIDEIKIELFQRKRELEAQHDAICRVQHMAEELITLGFRVALTVESEDALTITLRIVLGEGFLPEMPKTVLVHEVVVPDDAIDPVPDAPATDEDAQNDEVPPPPEEFETPPKPAPAAKKAGQHTRWSENEIDQAKKILLDGGTAKDVARATGRAVPASQAKCVELRRDINRQRGSGGFKYKQPRKIPEPLKSATSSPVAPSPQSLPEVRDGGPGPTRAADVPATERQVEADLNALGYAGGWDAQLDMELVELMVGGSTPDRAAHILDITRPQIVERFRALCPDPTPENQTKLLAVLRRRSNEE